MEDTAQDKTVQGLEGECGSPEGWDQVGPVDLSDANDSDLSGDIHQVNETKCSKNYGPTLLHLITDGGPGIIFGGLAITGIALASLISLAAFLESVDVERSASVNLPLTFLLLIFLLFLGGFVYYLAISFRYLVRTKPFCAHCGNRPVRFLGKLQGEWFLSDKKKRSVSKGKVDTMPCKAGVETFWECPLCNAVTRCWHTPDVKPSEKKKILKVNLVRDGVGGRASTDWEKKGLDSTCGESRDSWRK